MKRILFILPDSAFASMQFIVESIKAFAESGYQVDLLACESHDPPFGVEHPNIKMYYFHKPRLKGTYRFTCLYWAFALCRKNRYNFIIGVSQAGLLIAELLRRFGKAKNVIFYNDEIWLGTERDSWSGNLLGLFLKVLERRANKHVSMTVTQDMKRGRLLALVNDIAMTSIFPLPNSTSGLAQKAPVSFYLHDCLNIPRDKKIILWLGGIAVNSGALKIAFDADKLPDSHVLVFHFRSGTLTPHMRKIVELEDQEKIYISRETIPFEQLDSLIRSASIGLGLYADKGVNSRCIFHSSGRINSFLRFGIPCVVSDFIGFHWVAKGKAGLCAATSAKIIPAIRIISENHEQYRDGATETFNKYLNFDKAFHKILTKMEMEKNG